MYYQMHIRVQYQNVTLQELFLPPPAGNSGMGPVGRSWLVPESAADAPWMASAEKPAFQMPEFTTQGADAQTAAMAGAWGDFFSLKALPLAVFFAMAFAGALVCSLTGWLTRERLGHSNETLLSIRNPKQTSNKP